MLPINVNQVAPQSCLMGCSSLPMALITLFCLTDTATGSTLLTRRAAVVGASMALAASRRPPANALEDFQPPPSAAEPQAARRLYELCANRRASEWQEDERPEVDRLVQELADLRAPWPTEGLRGKWKLAYLQPGPNGAGVDRRVPFPE